MKFETMRDNLSGNCKGTGMVQIRCQGKDSGRDFVNSLQDAGVKFELKSMRNLRKEGPSTAAVSANPSAHHISTKDLDDQVKNGWLQDMRKQEERKEKLLREMRERRNAQ